VEIAIADVSRDRVDQPVFVFIQERVQFRKEIGIAARRHDEVIDKRRGVIPVQVFAQEREALAAHDPVFFGFLFVFLDLGAFTSRSLSASCRGFRFAAAISIVSSANSAMRTSFGTPPVATIAASGMNDMPRRAAFAKPICFSISGRNFTARVKV
jgi:hypothetical protein